MRCAILKSPAGVGLTFAPTATAYVFTTRLPTISASLWSGMLTTIRRTATLSDRSLLCPTSLVRLACFSWASDSATVTRRMAASAAHRDFAAGPELARLIRRMAVSLSAALQFWQWHTRDQSTINCKKRSYKLGEPRTAWPRQHAVGGRTRPGRKT